jgi:hypothetical protein
VPLFLYVRLHADAVQRLPKAPRTEACPLGREVHVSIPPLGFLSAFSIPWLKQFLFFLFD